MKQEEREKLNVAWAAYMNLLRATILYQALGVPIQEAKKMAEENPQETGEGMGDWAERMREMISAKSAEES